MKRCEENHNKWINDLRPKVATIKALINQQAVFLQKCQQAKEKEGDGVNNNNKWTALIKSQAQIIKNYEKKIKDLIAEIAKLKNPQEKSEGGVDKK